MAVRGRTAQRMCAVPLAAALVLVPVGSGGFGKVTVAAASTSRMTEEANTTPLTGQDILRYMVQADHTLGSVHYLDRLHSSEVGTSVHSVFLSTVDGDSSWRMKQQVLLEHDTRKTLPPQSPSIHYTTLRTVTVGTRSAQRFPGKPWQCFPSGLVAAANGNEIGSLPNHDAATANLVGSTRVDGVLTWHVHARSLTTSTTRTEEDNDDFYVAQSTGLLIRRIELTVASLRTEVFTLTVNDQTDYSRYGEAVAVTLPKACRVSAGERRA